MVILVATGILPGTVKSSQISSNSKKRNILWTALLSSFNSPNWLNKHLHPRRFTWNIILGVWKIIFLSKWVIGMFHVNLPRCTRNHHQKRFKRATKNGIFPRVPKPSEKRSGMMFIHRLRPHFFVVKKLRRNLTFFLTRWWFEWKIELGIGNGLKPPTSYGCMDGCFRKKVRFSPQIIHFSKVFMGFSLISPSILGYHFLRKHPVGGWTNPFEKYARQNASFPQVGRDENKKIFELPPPSLRLEVLMNVKELKVCFPVEPIVWIYPPPRIPVTTRIMNHF